MGLLAFLYGAVSYAIFLVVFLYAAAFIGNLPVPKTIDSGAAGPLAEALIINVLLLGVFAVQHSVMARPAFKRWWTRIVPHSVERSTYVLLASLALALLYWQWRPIAGTVWEIANPAGRMAMYALFALGWLVVLLSTFMINHFDLFGLRQVWAYRSAREIPPPEFRTPLFYKIVRHPLYAGFILAFWAAPVMTQGHLLFALATTIYILIAIQLEERDLIAMFGDQYRRYRERVSMLIPLPGGRKSDDQPIAGPRSAQR
jgi:protein-S-isoprenylcysteine O-methyltransferase Ste14